MTHYSVLLCVLLPSAVFPAPQNEHFDRAALLRSKKDYQGAVRELQAALKADPGSEAAKQRLQYWFWPLDKETSWTWEETVQGSSGTARLITRRGDGPGEFNGEPVFSESGDSHAAVSGGMPFRSQRFWARKEDGVYMLGEQQKGVGAWTTYSMVFKADVPILSYPYEMSAGRQWTSTYTIKASAGPGISYVLKNKVLRREDVTAPAGTFDCLAIKSEYQASMKEWETTTWFAPGIGVVKMLTIENPGKGERTVVKQRVLKEFAIGE